MNRSTRHILVLSLAVLTAGVASFGVYRAITQIPVREVEVASSYVAVVTRSLPPGVRLTEKDVRLAAWPVKNPVPGSYANIKDVVNRALVASVVENEPLVQSKLASLEAGAGLPPSIPPGMRAMAVKVNDVIGVAGFVEPGTRVDLVVTIRKREDSTSRTVVSNVQVLSAGTRYEQEKARTANTAQTSVAVVTLLVSPQDAERIALAQAEGQIMLVLRNPLDTEPTTTSGVRSAALFGGEPAPVVPAANVVRPREAPGRRRGRSDCTAEALYWSRPSAPPNERKKRWSVDESSCRAPLDGRHRARAGRRRPSGRPGCRGPGPGGAGATASSRESLLTAGRSTVVETDFDVTRIAVTNPAVADAVVVQPREILIDGKGSGTVSLIVWGAARREQYDLVVEKEVTNLQQQLQLLFPGEDIRVNASDEAIILSGQVSSNPVMLRAGEIAQATSSKARVINMLQLPGGAESQQVILQVRFAEVNRRALTELGSTLFTGPTGFKDFIARSSTQTVCRPGF